VKHTLKTLTVITLLASNCTAFAYTATNSGQGVTSPTNGYIIAPNSDGTCASGYTSVFSGAQCAYLVPASQNVCPAGAYTLNGYNCFTNTDGEMVYLGQTTSDMSNAANYSDWNTGNSLSSSVQADVTSQLQTAAAAAGSSSSGSSSSSSSAGLEIDWLSIFENIIGLQQGNTFGAIGAAAGIIIGIALLDLGTRKLQKVFGMGNGKGRGGNGRGRGQGRNGGGRAGGGKPPTARPNARRVNIGGYSYTLYRGRNGKYTRGPAMGRGNGRRRRR
jgi:hypothetical protein